MSSLPFNPSFPLTTTPIPPPIRELVLKETGDWDPGSWNRGEYSYFLFHVPLITRIRIPSSQPFQWKGEESESILEAVVKV